MDQAKWIKRSGHEWLRHRVIRSKPILMDELLAAGEATPDEPLS